MTIQTEDDARLNGLKKTLRLKTKIDVLRKALDVLEDTVKRKERGEMIQKAVKACAKGSLKVNREFRNNPLIHKWP